MESIGNKLKSIREIKNITLDQVARETNISRTFLQDLEEDNFENFPGESYLLGFLRTYSDFLGEEPDHYVSQYKNLKIQEEPLPMEALLEKKSSNILPIVLGALTLAALVSLIVLNASSIGAWFASLGDLFQSDPDSEREAQVYVLGEDNPSLEERFFPGDSIEVPVGELMVAFVVEEITNEVEIVSDFGSSFLKLGEEIFFDLDGNDQKDLRLYLKDIPSANYGITLVMERFEAPNALDAGPAVPSREEVLTSIGVETTDPSELEELTPVTILEVDQAEPFILDIVFRGNTLFRSQVDDNPREEIYYQKGETLRLEVSRRVLLGVSNAGAFTGKIAGIDVELGRPGEVAVNLLQWVREGNGPVRLQSFPLR